MKSKLKTIIRILSVVLLVGLTVTGLIVISVNNRRNGDGVELENTVPADVDPDVDSGDRDLLQAPVDNNPISEDVAGAALLFRNGKEDSEQGADDHGPSAVYMVNVGSSPKAVTEEKMSPLTLYFENKAIVNEALVSEYLNVRSEPDESSEVLAAAEPGMVMEILQRSNGWTYICIDGVNGWVKTEYILTGNAAAAFVEQNADPYAEVAVSSMNIRMGKSTASGILDVAYQGEAFPLAGMEDGWARVRLDDVLFGYLAGNCVTINYDWNGLIIATQAAGALAEEVKDMTPPKRPSDVQWEVQPTSPSAPTQAEQSVQTPSSASPEHMETMPQEPSFTEPPAEEPSVAPSAEPVPGETPGTEPSVDPAPELPSASSPSEETPTPQIPPSEPVREIIDIEAFYTGSSQKMEGDVMTRAEVCVYVYFSDGSIEIVTEGWTSNDIGMILHAGEAVISISYAGFTSNIVLQVAAAPTQPQDPSVEAPQPTGPQPDDSQPGDSTPAESQPTEPQPTQTPPGDLPPSDPTPAEPVPDNTEPADPAPSEPSGDEAYVNNVPLSGELTAYTLRICSQYGVDSAVVFSVMYQESGFNPNATSGSGAVGLMQIIQRYSQERMNRLGVTDLYDPKSNIIVGVDMLAEYYYTYGAWVPALTRYRYGTPNASGDYANLILSRASMFQ